MNNFLTADIKEISGAVHYRPAVSIIMPFEPKMESHDTLLHSLKIVTDKITRELRNNYPEEITGLMLQKLKSIMNNLHFNTLKKSIAIYVSPVFEKVLYLDIPVEEKIIIDESFEIRDLVYSKKQQHKYLLLLLSSNESKIFLGDNDNLVRIVSNRSENTNGNDTPEKVANFTDNTSYKEMQMEKFLHHVDHVLDAILNAYHLPLFVVGAKRIAGHFNSITKHSDAVVEYIHGNYEAATLPELADVLQPYIFNWKQVKQTDLLHQLDKAASAGKMVTGIQDVWREATAHKGKLLLVEKDFMYAAEHGATEDIIEAATSLNSFSYIKDAVDDIIEKVLQDGGDVEFTDKDALKLYDHIALIEYY
ncbi:MAG: hypothetical protein JST86_05590 [Bacteroidetes bacterium]|nr:hypothetical protein [Bacteroidota bacterium]